MNIYDPTTGLLKQQPNRPATPTVRPPSTFNGVPAGQLASTLYGVPDLTNLAGDVAPYVKASAAATPSYKDLIENDPVYKQMLTDLSGQGIADAAQRAAARQRAVVQFGIVPDLTKAATDLGTLVGPDLANDITPATQALAQQNTTAGLSTASRLQQQHTQNVRQITNQLAARGLLRSGETGYQLGQEDLNYRQGTSDATQKLLDYLAGVQAAYLAAERQRTAAQTGALGDAANRQLQLYLATSGGAGTPSSGTAGGATEGTSGAPSAPLPENAAYGDLISALQTASASAARQRGQRGEYTPLF